jgi:hypothetical protein|tara:strand:+ start:382 stop:555 length:174 start_codon:yes stop_codon:yes gene_type:complete
MSYLYQGQHYATPQMVWNAAVEKMRILQEQEMYEMCIDHTHEDAMDAQRIAYNDLRG